MGFIRGGIVFLLATGLFITLLMGNIFLTLNWSLEYDNVEPYIKNLTDEITGDSGSKGEILEEYEIEKVLCSTQESVTFTFEENEITIPCEVINQGSKAVIDYAVEDTIPKFYYKKYDCEFLNCLRTENQPLVLISETAKEYWGSKFQTMLLLSAILFALIFLFVKEKHTALTLTGVLIIFTALPFKQISWLLSFIPEILPFNIVPMFFTESNNVFLMMLIIGILFLAIGLSFNFFKLGMKIHEFYTKYIKKKDGGKKEDTASEQKDTTPEDKPIKDKTKENKKQLKKK